ncbi:MAG: hypothetical protein Q7T03_02010 [Deltaproteobacteria bacterium]|nr:hypothetical protein [Deltaproteobacteria bacterium]
MATKKAASKSSGKKAAFGGYTISFKGCTDSVEKVFGSSPIAPSQMTKKIWDYVKSKGLSKK